MEFKIGEIYECTRDIKIFTHYYITKLNREYHPKGTKFIVVSLHSGGLDIGLQVISNGVPFPNNGGSEMCEWYSSRRETNLFVPVNINRKLLSVLRRS